MLLLPALNTAGEKVGIFSFPQPEDYLYFDPSIHGQAAIDAVLETKAPSIWLANLEEQLQQSRTEHLRVALEAFENLYESKPPEWWKNMRYDEKLGVIANMLVGLAPGWEVTVGPDLAQCTLAVPTEEIASVLHVSVFRDRRLVAKLHNWPDYWRKRK